MKLRKKWCYDTAAEEALKYERVIDFKAGCISAYRWAERNGMLQDVTRHMRRVTNPVDLMQKIESELNSARRNLLIARGMQKTDATTPKEYDPEAISPGKPIDHDVGLYDQVAQERSERALEHIKKLQEVGTESMILEAWTLYREFQRRSMSIAATSLPERESELEQEVQRGQGRGDSN